MEIKKENLKENYFKNIKELKEIEKKILKAKEKEEETKKEIEKNTTNFIEKMTEKEKFLQIETQKRIEKKKATAKKQHLEIEKGLILNNLYNLISFDFKKIIYNDIFYKYTLKNIGEKTKEKISSEIKSYFKNNYNIDIYFYFQREYNYKNELSFVNFDIILLDTTKLYNNHILKYSTCLHIDGETEYHTPDLLKTKYNDTHAHFIYNYDENFIYNIIENTTEEAKRIFTTSKKLNEKIEKIKKEFEEAKKQNNELFKNNLYDFKNLYINAYIRNY